MGFLPHAGPLWLHSAPYGCVLITPASMSRVRHTQHVHSQALPQPGGGDAISGYHAGIGRVFCQEAQCMDLIEGVTTGAQL
jgi:hypothetical protein